MLPGISALMTIPGTPPKLDNSEKLGLDPEIMLDEHARYLNHLQQLRQIDAGDDVTDSVGYGLHLVRVPVSVLPGKKAYKGKGAVVSIEAKHWLTDDLLPDTFASLAAIDARNQLSVAVLNKLHLKEECSAAKAPCMPLRLHLRSLGRTPFRPGAEQGRIKSFAAAATPSATAGRSTAALGVASTELEQIYGDEALCVLVRALRGFFEETFYHHDPSVITWLGDGLAVSQGFIQREFRRRQYALRTEWIEKLGGLVAARKYQELAVAREPWFNQVDDVMTTAPQDVMAYALLIQRYLQNEQLKEDMKIVARRKGCICGDIEHHCFFDYEPAPEARTAFNDVACKWPVHVFTVDPVVTQQNELDILSVRSELQLAMAAGVSRTARSAHRFRHSLCPTARTRSADDRLESHGRRFRSRRNDVRLEVLPAD